jgi:hypothetical protein
MTYGWSLTHCRDIAKRPGCMSAATQSFKTNSSEAASDQRGVFGSLEALNVAQTTEELLKRLAELKSKPKNPDDWTNLNIDASYYLQDYWQEYAELLMIEDILIERRPPERSEPHDLTAYDL